MTAPATRLSLDEEALMGRRLQICLDLSAKRLYTIIQSDRKVLSNPAGADPLAFNCAEERRKRFAVGGLSSGKLKSRLRKLTKSVDHGFRILKQYGPPDGGAIADRFVEANQGLVGMIARRYEQLALLSTEELMQIGQLGLCLAALRYDPDTGKFSSFAIWWIKHFISRDLADTGRLIRLPVATVRLARAIEKEQRRFYQEHGRPPLVDELAMAVKCSPARVLEILPHLERPGSLDAPIYESNDNGATPYDVTPSDERSAEAALTEWQSSTALEAQLARLPPMEEDVVVCRLDLREGRRHQSLDQLGERYGYSREGIRQVYLRALKKLRSWLGPELGLD